MKNFAGPRNKWTMFLRGILVASAICFSACGRTPESLKKPIMTPLSPRLQSLFEKTKTVCFGRFVIEIPATAMIVFGPAEVGPHISYLPGEGGQIARHVARDLVEVENSRELLEKGDYARLPLFGKVIDGIVPGQKITFDSKNGIGYYINSYVPVGQDLFILFFSSVLHKNYAAKDFNVIASNLRPRADDEIPAEPGTCIAGGFLPMALEYERVRIGMRLKEFPDVHLSIDVHKNRDTLEEAASLDLTLKEGEELARAQGHGAAYARIKTLRRGARQLGLWKGFEIVVRKPSFNNDTEAHEFHFHSLGALHDPLQPQLDVRLDSGVKNNKTAGVKPSISDEEAVELWDKLIGTIRVRQTGDAKASKPTPAKMPLGKLTTTGDICTQQGWWQCTEGGDIEGGRRRRFAEGELMPHAILLGVPNLWQKLTGDKPRYQMATVWTLVDYDAQPAVSMPIAENASPLAALAPMPPLSDADAMKDVPPSMS